MKSYTGTEFKYSRRKIHPDLLSGSVLVSAAVSWGLGLWRHRHLQGQVRRLSHRRQCDLDQGAAVYLNPDPDPDPGSQINADPCESGSWSDFKVKNCWIFTWNIYWSRYLIGQKTYLRGYKSLLEKGQETKFICRLWSISMLLDPDPHSQ